MALLGARGRGRRLQQPGARARQVSVGAVPSGLTTVTTESGICNQPYVGERVENVPVDLG